MHTYTQCHMFGETMATFWRKTSFSSNIMRYGKMIFTIVINERNSACRLYSKHSFSILSVFGWLKRAFNRTTAFDWQNLYNLVCGACISLYILKWDIPLIQAESGPGPGHIALSLMDYETNPYLSKQ